MTLLKPISIYVEVDVNEEIKPYEHLLTFSNNGKAWFKEQQRYVFTEESLKQLLRKTWDASQNWNLAENIKAVTYNEHSEPNKTEYITSLFEQA